jgi:hypothetical protein
MVVDEPVRGTFAYLDHPGLLSSRDSSRCAGSTARRSGRSLGLSEATVEDASGRLLAHATSRCVLMPLGVPDAPPPDGPIPWPTYSTPHPFQRPSEGEFLPPRRGSG